MNYTIPFILLLGLFGGAQFAHAQKELISEIESPGDVPDEAVVDALSAEAEAAAVWDINDSLNYIPAFDEYCDWNSDRVHPYKYTLTEMTDTIVIPLAYDSCSFAAPFIGRKTSDFGYRRYRHHYGVDIKLYTGDPVLNAFDGVVRVAKYDGDYGRVVVVRHNNGLETLYAHLSELKVKEGDWVDAGKAVGLGGNTGRSTGSHLHFEVRYLGEPINPNEIIDWELGMLCSDTLLLNADHFEYLKEIRKRKYHRIRRGDTLSGIARRYGTTVGRICRLNGMRSTSTLRIGKTIRYN
ncbi:MAG: peptidoglycan DD-metalloendopeptidase family protein [Cryomorphaceae bacterium]|nr:peptidoglycan DD-metalloendopeptidase family protein [Flavobacteriales bacterium]